MTAQSLTGLSLTENEATERAGLVAVDRYDIAVDLRGLLEGEVLASVSTITFRSLRAGSTFVDCVAEVAGATLDGVDLDLASVADGRIPLPDLAEGPHVLVVAATQSDTASGSGVLRTVDSSDGLVYVWTSFEPDAARRVWACFDQPDLKAPHAFTVDAPAAWTVTSNTAPDAVADQGTDARRWTFPDTPPLSTYVVVVNAGPFHEIREQRGDHSLGLYCRQSLKQFLARDAEELLRVTEQGLAFFGERFAQPFPQERYDQVFVPDMGGAMENWGCVTWTDTVLFRSPPTFGERETVAMILLHEMAHMWFGDLVTMRWWDDLWLNEAFASWASTWAAVGATEFTDAWATYLAGSEPSGYQMDMGPASHPIRGEVPDVAQAMANFDAITYVKGQAVLNQLVAFVGEDAFVEGLRSYFRDHAWGNTRLADLMDAVGEAAGRDLTAWTSAWFDRAGTDTLCLVDGALVATGPDGDEPRPHRLAVASYAVQDDAHGSGLALVAEPLTVETTGTRTPLEGLPAADLHLVNHGDLTFAAVRTDEASLPVLLASTAHLPDALSRALAVTTAWDMLAKGELSTEDVLTCVLDVLRAERSAGVVEPFLALALQAADRWSAPVAVPQRLERVADVAAALAEVPDHRAPALRTLAASATTSSHFLTLESAAADDVDLAWRVLVRRAALGQHDPAAVAALLARDPDPESRTRALAVTAARPEESAKQEVWTEVFEHRTVPAGSPMGIVAQAFWRPTQRELLLPWAHRYLDEVEALPPGGLLAKAGLMRRMFPTVGDAAFLERATALATAPGTDPTVRTTLLTATDSLARALRAQA